MSNDFEKQVRQKMEELDFVPGEPVWTKIEEQIREKKERRRVIFWLPLFLLLVCGGVIWLNQRGTGENNTTFQKTANEDGPLAKKTADESTVGQSSSAIEGAGSISKTSENNNSENNKNQFSPGQLSGNSTTSTMSLDIAKKSSVSGKIKPGNKEVSPAIKEEMPATFNTAVPTNTVSGKTISDKNVEDKIAVPIGEDQQFLNQETKKSSETNGIKDSATVDSVTSQKQDSLKTVAIPKQKSKWRIAATGFAGTSGKADGLTVLNTEKSMADVNNLSTGGWVGSQPMTPANPYATSPIKNGFSFSLGASVVKQLSEKFRFSAGLEYNYLSNKMQVGHDSAGYVRAGNLTNAAMVGSVSYNFTNHYHFLSLPVDIAFAPLKKLPLDISAGVSLQQLIATNGLVYKKQYGAYVTDKESFTKTQLFSRVGLNYSVDVSKHKLVFGPQLNYSFSELLKDNTDSHLFSFGLRTAFIF